MIIDYTKLSPEQQARWRARSARVQTIDAVFSAMKHLNAAGKMSDKSARGTAWQGWASNP